MKRAIAKKPTKKAAKKPLRAPPSKGKGALDTKASSRWDEDVDSEDSGDEPKRKKGKKRAGEEDDSGSEGGDASEDESEEDNMETAEQKRRRLAKEYLDKIQGGVDSDEVGDEEDEEEGGGIGDEAGAMRGADRISSALRRERLEKQGKYFRTIGKKAEELSIADLVHQVNSDHTMSVTCVALSSDESTVYSGSKDNSIIMWDLESAHRRFLRPRWSREVNPNEQCCRGEILSVAATTDGRYLASGGRDMMVRIFDTRIAEAEVHAFQGHRDAVTSLTFRRDSYSLFSGSLDRCLKHWDLNEMGYLETLFGHQDGVMAVDCWTKERPISVSSDRTCRLWKIADETHLVFRGHKSTVDTVQIMTDEGYLSGGQDGSLQLWKETQKKPVASVSAAHGFNGANPRWICAIASVKMSDYAASGSDDGSVRLWNVLQESRKIVPVNAIPVNGFVNALAVSPRLIVAGTGREHRLGRWWNLRGNRNKVVVVRLPESLDADDAHGVKEADDDDDDEEEDDEAGGLGSDDEETD